MPDLETQDGGESLRDTISASFDAVEPAVETPVEIPEVTETAEAKAERIRDEGGRFAKAKEEPEVPIVDPAAPIVEARKAPSSWKKEAAAEFEKLPAHVQEEVLRRETDFHKGIEGFKSHAEAGKAYERAVAPYMETIKQFGVTPDVAIGELLKTDNLLRTAPPAVKAQKFMELAQYYGIDLGQQFDPNVAKLQAELYQIKQQQQQWQSQQESQQFDALNSDIERFKAEPGREHFEAVRAHMASLLQGGQAKDLQDAYDQAVYANPTTRASLLEQQRKEAEKTMLAQRASSASVSVRGSSPASGASAKPGGKSLRDDISAAFDEHN